ncbi:MAG: hypothetical protein J6Y44_03670, partial [Clostridia bacterium]|nr:hypothetical protein [Clostridia bacterium]
MVKAKEILFKVGKYLSLALAALYAIYAVIGIVSGIIGAASNTEEGLAVLIAAIITAVFTLIWAVIALFNSKYSSQAIETEDKKLYIINIVLGI